jgi:hypothetical protein
VTIRKTPVPNRTPALAISSLIETVGYCSMMNGFMIMKINFFLKRMALLKPARKRGTGIPNTETGKHTP